MKTSLVTVVLVALASALASVGAYELLRGSPASSQPALAVEPPTESSAARAPRQAVPLAPAPRAVDQPTDHEDRLAELERRIAALEVGSTSRAAPMTSATDELPPEEDLRGLVLEWVAEEREARGRAEEHEKKENRRSELEFNTRYRAHMLAREHELASWQENKLAQLFLEIEERRAEVEDDIDPLTDDPELVEARWVEFDEWADQRERELIARLDLALYQAIYGED